MKQYCQKCGELCWFSIVNASDFKVFINGREHSNEDKFDKDTGKRKTINKFECHDYELVTKGWWIFKRQEGNGHRSDDLNLNF